MLNHKRIILQSATGSGKSVIFSEMVRRAVLKNKKVLVLTHRIEIFESTLSHLSNVNIICEEIKAGKNHISMLSNVYVGMIETIKNRLKKGLVINPELIIVDECHLQSFSSVINKFPESFIIGISATPHGEHIPKIYQDIVNTIEIKDLIDNGFLMPCKAFQMQDDISDLKTKNGEYTDSSLFKHYNKPKLYLGVIEEWIKRCNGMKTLVFNCNIEHAKNMNIAFREANIMSEIVTSETPKLEREQILDAFKKGFFPVLNNCGVLVAGYDEPSIEVIIMNRATKSLTLWLQAQGRGSRPYPNKKQFITLDFGKNHNEHGLWCEPRKWELKPPKKKKLGAAPIRKCPKCEAMIPASSRVCQFCGHEFDIKNSEPKEGIMVEVAPHIPNELQGRRVSSLSVEELIELEKGKRYKPAFIWRICRSKGEDCLREYATLKGYKDGWLYNQKQKMHDSQVKDYVLK